MGNVIMDPNSIDATTISKNGSETNLALILYEHFDIPTSKLESTASSRDITRLSQTWRWCHLPKEEILELIQE